MNLESLAKAIEVRRSRRRYIQNPLEIHLASKVEEYINEYNQTGNIRMELVKNNGKAFNGLSKSYGMFSGVNNYIGLVADKEDETAFERLGYYGELLVLHSTAMGLGTCWVIGTFSRSNMPLSLSSNETLVGAITIGNTEEKDSLKERFIRGITHRKSKSIDQMYLSNGEVPSWFMDGMKSVQKAPSAINRQPVMFSYEDGIVSASVKDISDYSLALDMGIAKLHFEIGAGGGEWEWGNRGIFTHKPKV